MGLLIAEPILSLCLPTNVTIEWIFPVTDSIYAQNMHPNLYGVIVTNNGDNEGFENYLNQYRNNSSRRNLTHERDDIRRCGFYWYKSCNKSGSK